MSERNGLEPTAIDDIFDIDALERQAPVLRGRYLTARPFPHLVLDDVLTDPILKTALAEFPALDEATWTNWVHVNSRKYGNTNAATWPPALQSIARALTSSRFVAVLGTITGHDGLLADWSMDGGGLHQSVAGGFLNVHADFTSHHTHQNWRRRVNVLLYFNDDWDPAWGGALELWSDDVQRCEVKIEPFGNRMVVFTTTESSFHGHPDPLRCPTGIARKSMALYYFVEEDRPLTQSTDYRARPDDGLRAIPIYLDKQMLHVYDVVKRRFGLPDDAASRMLRVANRVLRRR